jgi:pilus assembly protein FimV
LVAEAAGLGKLTVLSGIGQPLRAELDIGATKEELGGMTARLASQDVFKQAGVDFATVLLDLRFTVEKRPNGQSVVKVSSVKPINEPFLDFLVELNWPAGRLVREYTFLLDPPEMTAAQSARPVAEARIVETVRGGGYAGESKPAPVKAAPVPRPAPAPKVAAEPKPKAESAGSHVVKQGETLRKIAAENKYDGVSLEQMLVGLFQSNPDAFVAENVNRLKSGAILNIPEQSVVESVSPAEARKIYVAHARDWNDYRQKLAASTAKMPAADAAATQTSSGKITAKVEEKAAPAEQSKDQVKVARTDPAAKGAAAGKAAETADQVAKDKALKDAQDRALALEKNVNELQKLLEMKNQKLAELQQPPAKKEEPKVVEAVKPVEPPKPVEAPKPPEPKVVEAAKPVEPPTPVEVAKPVEAAKPVEPPKPAEAPKPPVPKVEAPAPEQVEESSFVDSLLEDPLPLVGGGGVLALLAGYFLYSRRRTRSASVETTALPMPSSLGPNSVFRMTGGQSIDTGNTPPQTGEFSQTGPGTIDTDEVDPVAEADVYMAYGRDTQAEEILLEALQKDPQRTAIHAKLLEIYANRHSVKQFETLAGELYAQTAGVGPDWAKVALLGQGLDPNNPLYTASHAQVAPETVEEQVVPADDVAVDVPVEIAESLGAFPEPEPEVVSEAELTPVALDLSDEFEQDTMVLPKEPVAQADEPVAAETLDLGQDAMTLDFDLGEETVAPEIASQMAADADAEVEVYTDTVVSVNDTDALDFDLGSEAPPVVEAAGVPDVAESDEQGSEGLDFDLNIPGQDLVEEPAAPAPDFSPDGTLVMPSATVEMAEEIDVGLGTWVGGEELPEELRPEAALEEVPPAVSFAADEDKALTQTVVNHLAGSDTLIDSNVLNFGGDEHNDNLSQTVVNTNVVDTDSLEFDVKLTDSMFLGQPMGAQEFDIGSINLDLSAPPEAAPNAPAEAEFAPAEAPVQDVPAVESAISDAPVHNEQWEEVNTKLDLAKAYEEMGDLEGARELLQEVIGEGSIDLVEQARTVLARIGG